MNLKEYIATNLSVQEILGCVEDYESGLMNNGRFLECDRLETHLTKYMLDHNIPESMKIPMASEFIIQCYSKLLKTTREQT